MTEMKFWNGVSLGGMSTLFLFEKKKMFWRLLKKILTYKKQKQQEENAEIEENFCKKIKLDVIPK